MTTLRESLREWWHIIRHGHFPEWWVFDDGPGCGICDPGAPIIAVGRTHPDCRVCGHPRHCDTECNGCPGGCQS